MANKTLKKPPKEFQYKIENSSANPIEITYVPNTQQKEATRLGTTDDKPRNPISLKPLEAVYISDALKSGETIEETERTIKVTTQIKPIKITVKFGSENHSITLESDTNSIQWEVDITPLDNAKPIRQDRQPTYERLDDVTNTPD